MNEKDVIIACDFSSAEETLTFLDRFGGKKPYVKIGMELYYAAGPDMVRRILERGHRVFLDLKLHDIPNTVRKAMKNLARLGVHMTNLHAAGGRKMMQAAVEGLARGRGGGEVRAAAAHRGHAAHLHKRGNASGRAAHRHADGGDRRATTPPTPHRAGWTASSARRTRRRPSSAPTGRASSPSRPASASPTAPPTTRCGL